MKVRTGFVSNSSSSSFVCNVCGGSYEGYDGMYEVDCYTCEVDHDICEDCFPLIKSAIKSLAADVNKAAEALELTNSEVNELMGAEDKESWIEEHNGGCEMCSALCPVCNLTHISGSAEAQYLREKFGLKREDVLNEIRKKFDNFNKFKEEMKNADIW